MPEPDTVTSSESAARDTWFLRSVPLGGTALSQALQRDPALHGWLAARPRSRAEWSDRVERVRSQSQGRDWLTPLAPAIAATGRAAERLGRAAAHGVVVTTGQQPGLFGGPAYTWSKALSALGMADVLEAATGVPVAPVFWAASDDADWVEASFTHIVTSRGLETLALEGPATDGVAMADVMLGPTQAALHALRSASGSVAHESVLRVLEQAYVPHATIGEAYVQLLRAVLEPLGIAVLDAAHPALRHAADPLLRRALQQAPVIADALGARTACDPRGRLCAAGGCDGRLSLVFRTQAGTSGRARDRVRTRVAVADAARVVREADVGSLGANVLLRPVLERALLPTVAYHAGPGEYAYFAQVAPVAGALESSRRWRSRAGRARSLTRAPNAMRERLGLDEAALRDPHAAESLVARQSIDADVQDAMERLRLAVETQVRAVREALAQADPIVAPGGRGGTLQRPGRSARSLRAARDRGREAPRARR